MNDPFFKQLDQKKATLKKDGAEAKKLRPTYEPLNVKMNRMPSMTKKIRGPVLSPAPAAFSKPALSSEDDQSEEEHIVRRKLAKKILASASSPTDVTLLDEEMDAARVDRLLLKARRKQTSSAATLSTNILDGNEDEVLSDDNNECADEIFLKTEFKNLADSLKAINSPEVLSLGRHSSTVTVVCLSPDAKYIYSACKNGSIVKWDRVKREKVKIFRTKSAINGNKTSTQQKQREYTSFYAMALSPSGQFLVAGGRDHHIYLWETEMGHFLKRLEHHRAPITGLAFRQISSSNILYSCSKDRMIKCWDIDQLAYLDTLFGPQDVPQMICALSKERCLTVNGRDRVARLFKIIEETQLLFDHEQASRMLSQGSTVDGSIDHVAMLNEDYFVTAGERHIYLWFVGKKKPVFLLENTYEGGFIQALCALPYTDLFFTAGAQMNGQSYLTAWKLSEKPFVSFEKILDIPLTSTVGFVNYMAVRLVGSSGSICLALALGRDQRLGRWNVYKDALNQVMLVELPYSKLDMEIWRLKKW